MDHIIGTPVLLALGLQRRKRHPPARVARVGILSCSAIGDTIIASAIARDLKVAFPGCHVIAFISPMVRGIVSLVEGFDQEVSVVITNPLETVRILRSHPTDVLIDITPWPRMTAVAMALARSSFTIGFKTERQHRHFAYDAAVPHLGSRHEVDNYRALLAPLGIDGRLRPRARAEFRTFRQEPNDGDRIVVLHPWASGFRSTMREWPATRWTIVAREIIADGAKILITGGPSDRHRAEALAAMIDRPGRVTVLAGATGLPETVRQMASAAVVISVNTGIMHLAAALDQSLIALHGPTNPIRWGPLSDNAVVVGPGQREGGAFLNLGFEYPTDVPDCMAQIGVEEVLGHARRHVFADQREEAFQGANVSALVIAGTAERDYSEDRKVPQLTGVANQGSAGFDYAPEHSLAYGPTEGQHPFPHNVPHPRGAVVKRTEDLICAVLLLILTSPVLLLISLAIKLESPGPAFFRHERYGFNGRVIRIYKFRSMYDCAEDESDERQTARDDPRLTRVGRFLRKHSLDELPQLLNVLMGEMSLVGPRPHAVLTRVAGLLPEDIAESYELRHRTKPGITGLAQVNGWGGPLDTVEKVVRRTDYDLLYIKNWSLWLDLRILMKTIVRMWHNSAAC